MPALSSLVRLRVGVGMYLRPFVRAVICVCDKARSERFTIALLWASWFGGGALSSFLFVESNGLGFRSLWFRSSGYGRDLWSVVVGEVGVRGSGTGAGHQRPV